MNIAIALVAAALAGAGLVLQQQSAAEAPTSYFLHLRLITELLHKRRWLAGIGIMATGQALSVWAIGHLELTVAEPLLATSLVFALLLAMPLTGQRVRRSELLGALLLLGGVAALSVSRSVRSAGVVIGSNQYWWAAAVVAAIALLFLRAGWRRSGQQRAMLTGLALSPCLTKVFIGLRHNASTVTVTETLAWASLFSSAGSAGGQALASILISGPGLQIALWGPAVTVTFGVVAAALSGHPFAPPVERAATVA